MTTVWLCMGGYLVSYFIAFAIIGRLRARQLYREHGALKAWHKKDDILPSALFGALLWPVVLPSMAVWKFAVKVPPPPDPKKIEGKKDWVEGYDDDEEYEEPW